MTVETGGTERSLLRRWIVASTLGWLLGFALVVVLAMVWDMVGGGAQFMVGVGMGAGVGFLQGRVIRDRIGGLRPWVWTSTVGMGVPFVLWDLGSSIGWSGPFSLPTCVLLGAVLTGVLQERILRPRFERTSRWIAACVVGWGVPAGFIALGSSRSVPPLLSVLSPIFMFLGGAVLGAVTGKTLEWMAPREPANTSAPTH